MPVTQLQSTVRSAVRMRSVIRRAATAIVCVGVLFGATAPAAAQTDDDAAQQAAHDDRAQGQLRHAVAATRVNLLEPLPFDFLGRALETGQGQLVALEVGVRMWCGRINSFGHAALRLEIFRRGVKTSMWRGSEIPRSKNPECIDSLLEAEFFSGSIGS